MESRSKISISDYQPLSIESLGKPIHVIRDRLDSLISSSCGSLCYELQNWQRSSHVEVSVQHVSLHAFMPNELNKSLTSTFLHQSGGRVFIYADSPTLINLVDSFYDAKMKRNNGALSNSDLRLQEKVGWLIASWLAPKEMWSRSQVEPTEGHGLYAALNVNIDDHQGTIHIKLDELLVNTLTEQLELTPHESLYQPFCQSLTSTPVKLNVLLSKKTMPLNELILLQPNDVLPIDLLTSVPASIGNEPLFAGRVAEKDGQLVLIINHDKDSFNE
ncbi:FliM/FliN family flagellar motor switch protein [Vibrio ostreicida]|uniref:FliM/FliN family flagellar motor switch protein n=1 Tax=Vibrio ostreicida TaxID=526588 RepID=A0ABT8BQP8_9VIBR|nr:flagellar motor switch protein FliM [Vibrio ostreicida]MDN3609467.1 FliM/FliN family flagellar motor switch protein [Vibrio ostreicida]NPD08348.1 flagellar motor switch protein FliM [Vibrio ostreicida]